MKEETKYSSANKKRWSNPEYKKRVSKKISKTMKGNKNFLGKKHSEETKNKIRNSEYHKNFKRRGKENYNWKGDNAKYGSIHGWILKNFKLPGVCEICKKIRKLEWSNKNHKYSRKRKDWQAVCRSCHRRYDFENKR
jgi:hypothetical protein